MAAYTNIVPIFLVLISIVIARHLVQATDLQQSIHDELWKRTGVKAPALSVDETFDKLKQLLDPPFGDAETQQRIKYLVDVYKAKMTKCNRDDLGEMYRVKSYNELELHKSLYRFMRDCYIRQLNLCLHDLDGQVKSLRSESDLGELESDKMAFLVKRTKNWDLERALVSLIYNANSKIMKNSFMFPERRLEKQITSLFEHVVMEMCNKVKSKFGPLLDQYNEVLERGLTDYLDKETRTWMKGTSLCSEIENHKQQYIKGCLKILKRG